MNTMTIRIRCCRCGRVDRALVPVQSAFAVADGLLRRTCPGTVRGGPCNSRDRRLDLRAG